jgi:hypothetical protein
MGKTHLQQGTDHEIGKIFREIMLKKQAKSLAELIGSSNTEFANLADAARLRADLSNYLRNNMDKSLADGFVHCNIRDDGTLVIIATNSEWASRLRFEAHQFIDLCRKRGTLVQTVKVRVSA